MGLVARVLHLYCMDGSTKLPPSRRVRDVFSGAPLPLPHLLPCVRCGSAKSRL